MSHFNAPDFLPVKASNSPKRRHCHVQPLPPTISLDMPGRLRTAHVLALCGIAHSTLYARIKADRFPPPDGRDGGCIFWRTSTIKAYLET